MTSSEIRQSFLDFFRSKGHTIVPSSSLLPDSPNLLFTNAGMNQFVPIFLGQQKAPFSLPRAADTQKCIRAGGKHNDLEDVGLDTYHHTFFEMLGNWSFGDYFKKEAIEWAWELVTEVWKFPKERLYATVYCAEDAMQHWPRLLNWICAKAIDQDVRQWGPTDFQHLFYGPNPLADELGLKENPDFEAAYWWAVLFIQAGLDPAVQIRPGNRKDNFWMMGETGPCGPCSEIHVDLTPGGDTRGALVNKGDARCIEIWNLVFIQFNANPDGTLTALPARHVDTGMGFERVTSIIQGTKGFSDFRNGKVSNYETDIFRPLFSKLEELSGKRYVSTVPSAGSTGKTEQEKVDVAFRVIADHIRALSFAIADGIQPGNTDRNYVLRRILRRAVRYGRILGFHEPFLHRLVTVLAETMGNIFPEIRGKRSRIEEVVRGEEESFNRTLDRGLEVFEEHATTALDDKGLRQRLATRRHLFNKYRCSSLGLTNGAVLSDPKLDELVGAKPTTVEGVFQIVGRNPKLGNQLSDALRRDLCRHIQIHVNRSPGHISSDLAMELYDTYGFPLDLTQLIARERGLTVETADFEEFMNQQRDRARAAQKREIVTFDKTIDVETRFVGYDQFESDTTLLTFTTMGGSPTGAGSKNFAVVDVSPLYAEAGGQVGDTGWLYRESNAKPVRIRNTIKRGSAFYLEAELGSDAMPGSSLPFPIAIGGEAARLVVDRPRREAIQRHHTVTHLLHWALHEVVSREAAQKGSYVGPEKLTFDFNSAALTPTQIRDVEKLVNERIVEGAPVSWVNMPYAEVKGRKDIMQLFGEKYGDDVRVVQIGGKPQALDGYSLELCGGTHTRNTGEVGLFRIMAEAAIASGVRRIEAVAGLRAYEKMREEMELLTSLAGKVNSPVGELEKKIDSLLAQQKELEKQLKALQQKQAAETARTLIPKAQSVGAARAIIENLGVADGDYLQAVADAMKGQFKGVIVLGGVANGAVSLVAAVSQEFVPKIQAGKIIQAIAPIVGGKGGGRPDNARGGGRDASKLNEALTKASEFLKTP